MRTYKIMFMVTAHRKSSQFRHQQGRADFQADQRKTFYSSPPYSDHCNKELATQASILLKLNLCFTHPTPVCHTHQTAHSHSIYLILWCCNQQVLEKTRCSLFQAWCHEWTQYTAFPAEYLDTLVCWRHDTVRR